MLVVMGNLPWIFPMSSVVYFDQLSGAAQARKLVETFFKPFSTYFYWEWPSFVQTCFVFQQIWNVFLFES